MVSIFGAFSVKRICPKYSSRGEKVYLNLRHPLISLLIGCYGAMQWRWGSSIQTQKHLPKMFVPPIVSHNDVSLLGVAWSCRCFSSVSSFFDEWSLLKCGNLKESTEGHYQFKFCTTLSKLLTASLGINTEHLRPNWGTKFEF